LNPTGQSKSPTTRASNRGRATKKKENTQKAKMRSIKKRGASKNGGGTVKKHVQLTASTYPMESKAALFKSTEPIHTNSLGLKNFCQLQGRAALKGGPSILMSMSANRLHSEFGEGKKSFKAIATSLYQVEMLALLDAIWNPEEAEILFNTIKNRIPLINKEGIMLQECK
jgi:hypothetical protein